MSLQDGQTSRSAGGTTRERPNDQSEKISQIEKSVTHLLVATKQLLEILTAWSRREASEINVSDVYVRLGYEFNIACRAFNSIGVETQDLGPVPDLLRNILEDTLSNEPSQASLEQYLPRIRDIIVNLLQGLKRKQQRLRQKNGREAGSSSASESRQVSAPSTFTSAPQIDDRQNPAPSIPGRSFSGDSTAQNGGVIPAFRMSSAPTGRASPVRVDSIPPERAKSSSRIVVEYPVPPPQVPKPPNTTVTQEIPSIQPGPFSMDKAFPQPPETSETPPSAYDIAQPRPQLRQHDALTALQRGGELERRASRRFSAYQIQKHLGPNANGIPMIPPSQHSPIPNRGRDTTTARTRGSPLVNNERAATVAVQAESPTRHATTRQANASDGPFVKTDISMGGGPFDSDSIDSPMVKTPEDKLRAPSIPDNDSISTTSTSTTTQPPSILPTTPIKSDVDVSISQGPWKKETILESASSMTTKDLTLFLQYKTKIKKFVLPDGYEELSIARLQLAFMDKFAWNTNNNGLELPEIYIQDPISGVRYELEDMNDVKNSTVLALNIDELGDVKRHLDDGLGSLKQIMEGVRNAVDDQKPVLQLLTEIQQDAAKSIARFNVAPPQQVSAISDSSLKDMNLPKGTKDRIGEIQNIRRDLAVMRQTYTGLMSDMEASMAGIRAKASTIKAAAVTASLPTFEGPSGRAHVDAGKKTLSDDSEKIINRVDDLQDIVEDLRKDVVSRGVRPLPRQLETVSKEISTATAELKKLLEFIKREKPIWTKIWRNELEVVYDDQKNLNMQEELAADLEKDLLEAANTFALVEEATKQQNLGNPQNTPTRGTTRVLTPANVDVDPQKAKDGVLGEVRALQPNHETRLEAIERAEKARQKELENRKEGAFKKELTGFVDEGRLKKSGGVQEAERLRRAKDDRIRKEVWERMSPGSATPFTEVETSNQDTPPPQGDTSESTPEILLVEAEQSDDKEPAADESVIEELAEHGVGQPVETGESDAKELFSSEPTPKSDDATEKPADVNPNTVESVVQS